MDDDINALYCLAFGLCQNILAKVVLLAVEGAWGELGLCPGVFWMEH